MARRAIRAKNVQSNDAETAPTTRRSRKRSRSNSRRSSARVPSDCKIVAAIAGGFVLAGFQLFHSILD
jgi:hypothetical protein